MYVCIYVFYLILFQIDFQFLINLYITNIWNLCFSVHLESLKSDKDIEDKKKNGFKMYTTVHLSIGYRIRHAWYYKQN